MTMTTAIEVRGLHKAFGKTTVLDGIDLDVAEGSVFCLLGPNGAGKTTTVRILATLVEPDHGEIRVAGHDARRAPREVRGAIGLTGQFSAVDGLLTGEENLRMTGMLHHLPKPVIERQCQELLTELDLVDAAKRPASTYSGGMKRRLDLAMSLMSDPRVIFLDEPTTGLDPRSRQTLWQIVRRLVDRGVTIFLTTQYLEEADQLADRIAMLHRGKIVAQGTAEQLKALTPGGHISLQVLDERDLAVARSVFAQATVHEDELRIDVPSDGSVRDVRSVLDQFQQRSIEVDKLTIRTPTLDDVFFTLTGSPADEAKKEASA